MKRGSLVVCLCLVCISLSAPGGEKVEAVRVLVRTERGDVELELYPAQAPVTVANFLRHADGKFYDGGTFHRTVRPDNQPDNQVKIEVIQAGINPAKKDDFPPIRLERTRDTGLRHRDGTISMARDGPDTATSDFFICVGDQPELDFAGKRNPDGQGFAAFGKVVKGMEVVRKIQAGPAKGQSLDPPVKILALKRIPSAAADARSGPTKPVAEKLADWRLLHGPWEPGPVYRESVLFVQGEGGRPAARLLFDLEKVLAVHSADGKQVFEADRDYQVAPDRSGLVLPVGSRIFFRKEADLFPAQGSPHSIGHRAGHPGTSLLFGEGHFFHDQQIEVSYVPRQGSKWTGYRPVFAGKTLPATLDRLRNRKGLTVAVSGDSISQGYNASGFTRAPPFMPPYADLVAAQLEQTYGTKVTLQNRAVAGWSVGNGGADVNNLVKGKPDLVLVAYGMNDVGGRNPEGYKGGIAAILRRVKEANPAAEVILVASMMGNPQWASTPPEMFPKYRDALASLQGPGVALADMTAVWEKLLERKRFVDMTGNGVNHPNDYGHRLYAQAVLALLVDPELVRLNPRSTQDK